MNRLYYLLHLPLILLLWVVFMLALSGCSWIGQSAYYTNIYSQAHQANIDLHQCAPFVLYRYSSNVDTNQRKTIEQALEWWSEQVNVVFVESDEGEPDLYFTNNEHEYHGNIEAKTTFKSNDDGCISDATTVFMYSLDGLPWWKKQLVVRHELGHVLGLKDSSNSRSIMFYKLDHLVDIDSLLPGEVEALKLYY